MTDIRTDNTGRQYVLDDGVYRPVTAEEAEILRPGAVETALEAAWQATRQIGGGIGMIGGTVQEFLGVEGAADPSRALLEDSTRRLDMMHRLRPEATVTGSVGAQALEFAVGMGIEQAASRGARAASVSAARRRAASGQTGGDPTIDGPRSGTLLSGEQVELSPGEASREQLADVGAVADALDAGAAETRGALWNTLANTPGLREVFEEFERFVGVQFDLSNLQRTLLDEGVASRVNFQFLPGQENGNGVISEIIKSQPFMRDALEPILTHNAQELGRKVMRAMGLSGDFQGPSSLGQATRDIGERFQRVAGKIGDTTLTQDQFDKVSRFLSNDMRDGIQQKLDAGETLSGHQIMDIRSRLQKRLKDSRRNNDSITEENILEGQAMLDDLIDQRLAPEDREFWQDAQQAWRVRMALENVVNDQGEVSVRQLNNSLERMFLEEYKYNDLVPTDGKLNQTQVDLLDFVRLSTAFSENLGDSGTATRNAINLIFRGPEGLKTLAAQRAGSKFITDVILNDPDRAARMVAPGDFDDIAD